MKTLISKENTGHLYIVADRKICGGSPTIRGTRTTVIDIAVQYELMGMEPDQIIEQYPHLNLAQIHDALSYYFEHKKTLDEEYRESKELIAELKELYPSRINDKFSKWS